MDVAIVASEAVPFAKTGGLADVAGALPPALARLGHNVSLFLPGYSQARRAGVELRPTGVAFPVDMAGRAVEARVLTARLPGSDVDVYFIDQPAYFDRDGLYQHLGADYGDNCERFAFFSRAVITAIGKLGRVPDIIHCNDWQSALIPVLLRERHRDDPAFRRVGTLLTVHNLAYQGVFWHWDMPLLGVGWGPFRWDRLEYHGRINFLKGGLVDADLLNTVSPTYAREIQRPELGCGLDGLLRGRSADLRGIVNGIDKSAWNPAVDPLIASRYGPSSFLAGKAACKAFLQRRSGLIERPDVPLFAQIGRLDPQKGWDLLADVADELLEKDVQLVVLGEGAARYKERLDHLAARHPGKVRAFLEFSNALAHQIEAGADLFLMPSLYEPCGLNQLYSLAYGTVPVVHATGGLADTVVDATAEALDAGRATGFAFDRPDAEGLRRAVDRALAAYADPGTWPRLVAAGMAADWSWDRSAAAYERLYEDIRRRRRGEGR